MKMARSVMMASAVMVAAAESVTPVGKVLQLMTDLQGKIVQEGQQAQKLYAEAAELCEDQSKDLQYSIKTGKADTEELNAAIDRETSKIGALGAKIEELTGIMADGEKSLKDATQVRNKEAADFAAEEKELSDVISMLTRAIGILEREMAKGSSAALLQLKNADSIVSAMNVLVDAFSFRSDDADTLTALIQNAQGNSQSSSEDEEEDEAGAPAGAVYKQKGGNIVSTMEELLDKAQGQLSDARNAETQARQAFDLTKQSIEDENGFAKKDFEKAQKGLSAAKGAKSTSEGDLTMTTKQLKEDTKALDELRQDCLSKAQDYEAAVKSRASEMTALTDAKKLVAESVGGAEEQSYASASFLQVSRSKSEAGSARVVKIIRRVGLKQHSRALMLLAQRITTTLSAHGSADPFGKVRDLITDMIAKLEEQGDKEASHKAYCDKEMAETKAKEEDKTTEIESLTTKIDQMSSAVDKLKGQIRSLSSSLSEIAAAQAEADKLRQKEHAQFVHVKADLEQGIDGVQRAMKVLKDYYSSDGDDHGAASGAGSGIIGLLEVIESDFSQGLAEIEANEDNAARAYKQETDENQVETASKQQDVKFKSQEVTSLEKQISDNSADRTSAQSELDAVLEYKASLKKQCVAKPESHEERKGRREAEIAGLKEALSTLEGQSFLQRSSRHVQRHLRATA